MTPTPKHTPSGFKVMSTSITGHSLLVGIEEGRPFPSFSIQMPTNISERLAHRDSCHDKLVDALKRANQDINWMLNNKKFLNPPVFDYIDAALAAVEGE